MQRECIRHDAVNEKRVCLDFIYNVHTDKNDIKQCNSSANLGSLHYSYRLWESTQTVVDLNGWL